MNEKVESREREAEEHEQRTRRAQQQQQLEQLNAQRSEDWQVWFRQSLYAELTRPGGNPIIDGLGDVIAIERAARQKEIKAAIEEVQRAVEAKLEALEQRQHQAQQEQTAKDQAAWEKFYGEVLATERAARQKELKSAVEEQQRVYDAKLAALEQRHHQVQQEQTANNQATWEKFYGEVLATERATRHNEVKDAIEEERRSIDAKLQALEQRIKSVPGKLPIAKTWQPETVIYQAEFVSHEGSLYQARTDTAQAPGGSDWVCVARAGRDAITPNVRGTYNVHEDYKTLDIVTLDGASFVATRDNPKICPGEGWQLLSRQGRAGRKGDPGERGPAGPKGDQGPTRLHQDRRILQSDGPAIGRLFGNHSAARGF